MTRGADPHIFLVRALLGAGLSEKDITPVLLQHADGKTALIRCDIDEAVVLADRVLVMRPRPGRLFDRIEINLGRPRDCNSPLFENFKRSVLTSLDRSVPDLDATQGPGQAMWW